LLQVTTVCEGDEDDHLFIIKIMVLNLWFKWK